MPYAVPIKVTMYVVRIDPDDRDLLGEEDNELISQMERPLTRADARDLMDKISQRIEQRKQERSARERTS